MDSLTVFGNVSTRIAMASLTKQAVLLLKRIATFTPAFINDS